MSTELNETHIGKMIEVWDVKDGPAFHREFVGLLGVVAICRDSRLSEHLIGWSFGRPIKTEGEKLLEKFKGKKIREKTWISQDKYIIPELLDPDGGLIANRYDGTGMNFQVIDCERWELWEEPKPEMRLMTLDELWGRVLKHSTGQKFTVNQSNPLGWPWSPIADRFVSVDELHKWGHKWADNPSDEPKSLMVEVKK